jgi:hypothetical protein
VFVLVGHGDGTFTPTSLTATVVEGSYTPSVGDLDRDGNLDFVVARRYLGVDLFFGRGDGTFSTAKNLPVGTVEDTAITDLDGNDTLDLLLGGARLMVLPGRGDGTFGAAIVSAVPSWRVLAADFDGDGHPDVAGVQLRDPGQLSVSLGDGQGRVGPARAYAVDKFPYGLATTDLNHDGRTDLIVASLKGSLDILLGASGAAFASPIPLSTGMGPLSVAVGDFNGDGKLDLATANQGGDVSILLNESQ